MPEHIEHARDGKRVFSVNALDAAFGDLGADDEAVREAGHVVFGGVFGQACDLRTALDACGRLAQVGTHDAHSGSLRLTGCAYPSATEAYRAPPGSRRARSRVAPGRS